MSGDRYTSPPEPSEVELAMQHFEAGENFEGLSTWFAIDPEVRADSFKDALCAADEKLQELYGDGEDYIGHLFHKPGALNNQQTFLLRNFGPLHSPTLEKMFATNDIMSRYDSSRFQDQDGDVNLARDYFEEYRDELGLNVDFFEDDFQIPGQWVQSKFSVNDMRQLLKKLTGRIPNDGMTFKFTRLLTGNFVDLIADKELTGSLPEHVFGVSSLSTVEWFNQFLPNRVFPSVAALEMITDETRDTLLPDQPPIGAHYFALIRRAAHFHLELEGIPRQQQKYATTELPDQAAYDHMINRVFGYLMSDKIMKQVQPYLESDTAYNDLILKPGAYGVIPMDNVVATGYAARALKQQQLQEAKDIVLKHLNANI
jgi:hypothetical protein